MPSSGMLRRVAHLKTNISDECIATISRVTRIGELGPTLLGSVFFRSMLRLLVTANVVHSSPILVTLMIGDTLLRNVGSYKSLTA
jgi:hypothetical protein